MKKYFKNNPTLFIKKCISVLLILFGICFVLLNRDEYYSVHKDYVPLKEEIREEETIIEFSGNHTFEQVFYGWDGVLSKATIRFYNQGRINSTGSVTVNILSDTGELLVSSDKSLTKINASDRTAFAFDNDITLEKDKQYLLQIITHDAYNPQGFGLYTHIDKGDLFGQLSQDGNKIDSRLRATFIYTFYSFKALRSMLVLLLLALVFVLIPFERVDTIIKQKTGKAVDTNILISRIFFLATPVLCVLIGDRFNGFHLSEMIERMFSFEFLFNLMIYVTIWMLVYMVVNRTQYTSIIVLVLTFVADIANYYVWLFRGCPILAADVQSATTAANVAANFSYSLDMTGIWGVVYIISFVSMLLSLKGYPGLKLKKRLLAVAASVVLVLCSNALFFRSDFVATHVKFSVWHPQTTYGENGNALSFVLSCASARIHKPSGYSVNEVKKITEEYVSDSASDSDGSDRQRPNIIAIMNEAWADLNYNNTLDLSEDYLPFLHSMKENTIKGKLYVSIEGANTANTEFEFLTGDTLNFLPYRVIAYNEYIKDITPSMAYTLKDQGYCGINAYHPFLASGWNRTNAYPLLGFHNFYDQEYYKANGNADIVRNYISDDTDFKQIIDDFETAKKESSDPFYLFNVTMQNHGSYTGSRGMVDTKIKIQDKALYDFEAEQYVNLAKLTDDSFKMLIDYFKKVEEPTIIVMFGDHQPPIRNDFYSAQFGKDVDNLSVEQKSNWYSTPYVIWANYDIPEQELDMSANYLSSYVMNLAGLKLTGYNKFLLDLQKELPVISAVCYKDKDGNIYANDEESKYSTLLHTYEILQYNHLFDTENLVDEFFFLKE